MASPMSTTMAARLPRRSPMWVPRSRSQPETAGQAQGVTGVEAVADVEPAGRVPDRSADAAEDDGQWGVVGPGSAGDPAESRLQTEGAGETGRDTDGAAAVAGRAQREDAAGHRRRRAPR